MKLVVRFNEILTTPLTASSGHDMISVVEEHEMTVEELTELSNEKIEFRISGGTLMVRSLAYRYADYMRLDFIASLARPSDALVALSVPKGTFMGDHDIDINLRTGIVTADGKTYDDLLPDRPKKRFSRIVPTINGFSVENVSCMPSTDGYAVSCDVCFNGVEVGTFLDLGDGSPYSFHAVKPYDAAKIESVVGSFPPIRRDYGLGMTEFRYDMGILVDRLTDLREIAGKAERLWGEGKDYVLLDDWKHDRHFEMSVGKGVRDGELRETLEKRGLGECEVRRYGRAADLVQATCGVARKDLIR